MLVTCATGRCSTVPAEALTAAGVTEAGAVPGHHEAAGAGRQGAARHGPKVARIADLVEHDHDVGAQHVLGRGVAERVDLQSRALVVAAPRELIQFVGRYGVDGQPRGQRLAQHLEGRRVAASLWARRRAPAAKAIWTTLRP